MLVVKTGIEVLRQKSKVKYRRLLSPHSVSLRNLSGEPALYGAGSSLWPFPLRYVSSVCAEGSRVSTPEKATRAWPIKGVKDLSENCAA